MDYNRASVTASHHTCLQCCNCNHCSDICCHSFTHHRLTCQVWKHSLYTIPNNVLAHSDMNEILTTEKYLPYDSTMDILYYTCNDASADNAKVSDTHILWIKVLPATYVCLQITPFNEGLTTHITRKWQLSSVYAFMLFQSTLLTEWLTTHITGKWPLLTVYTVMYLQIALQTKWFITHTTWKWPLPTIYALMLFHSILLNEWLITYITTKRPLSPVCTLVWFQITLVTEWLITHITWKRPLPL